MPNNIEKEIAQLKYLIENDTINLTRNDQNSIIVQIDVLKDFIANKYDERRKQSGLSE